MTALVAWLLIAGSLIIYLNFVLYFNVILGSIWIFICLTFISLGNGNKDSKLNQEITLNYSIFTQRKLSL